MIWLTKYSETLGTDIPESEQGNTIKVLEFTAESGEVLK